MSSGSYKAKNQVIRMEKETERRICLYVQSTARRIEVTIHIRDAVLRM